MWTMKKNVFAFGSNDLRKCQGTLKLLWEFVKNVDNDKKCVFGRCRRRQLQLDGRNLICHTVSSPGENKSETFEKNFHCCSRIIPFSNKKVYLEIWYFVCLFYQYKSTYLILSLQKTPQPAHYNWALWNEYFTF